MSDQTPENGDEAFGKFIDDNSSSCNCPNNISLIILALREKVRHLSSMYNTTLGAYLKLGEADPVRAEMGKFISKLMEQSNQSLNQFDFIFIDGDMEEEENGSEPSNI
jgi:hypothetical protein